MVAIIVLGMNFLKVQNKTESHVGFV